MSIASQPTPGPWGFYFGDGEIEVFAERSIADLYIYLAVDPADKSAPSEADIRLIAASPDLLEAAKRALNFIANTESEQGITLDSGDALRCAIAKAEQSA